MTTKTSIQTRYPSQQSRGLAHTTPRKIDGQPQSPKMPQRAPVTTPHVDGEGSEPGFGLAFTKPKGDKSQVLPLSPRACPDLDFANAFDDALFVQNMWGAAPTPLRDSLELLPAPQSSGVTQTTSGTVPHVHGEGNSPRSGLTSAKPLENEPVIASMPRSAFPSRHRFPSRKPTIASMLRSPSPSPERSS